MSENDSARRVVLLARPGPARDRMREALAEAAADVVLEADPTATDPSEVMAARPDVALIVLDAATDEALDRFDALLSDASVEVLFEEAEMAVGRVGWDAARWVRHLAAKLHRSGDVLPPGHGGVAAPEHTQTAATPETPPTPSVSQEAEVAAEWSLSDLQLPEPSADASTAASAAPAPEADALSLGMLELESTAFDMPAHVSQLPGLEVPGSLEPPGQSASVAPVEGLHDDLPSLEAPEITFAPLQLDEEFLTTTSDAIEPIDLHANIESFASGLDDAAAGDAGEHRAGPVAPQAARLELELLDDTDAPIQVEGLEVQGDDTRESDRFQNDLADLHSRIASMELVVDRAPTQVRGAVLVMAGIGGPDAVRQLLGALPDTFPRAVLVQQRLDGGHYDKLVAQMQRATQLLVELAVPGRPVEASSVYILPPTVGVEEGARGMQFNEMPGDLLAALPAGDSAVLMLSGSDPGLVDAVMKLSAGGALVAAQALDGCYDVAAPAALASRGGAAAKPQDLARRLAERWNR
ncbi:chemotaxis protein CheB [Agrilutibacter solisilvae]|uniref:CheB-type methylesterase domain-containing protein n=1 Tax=Agrilutibacter solisilvae TaxID=2763317 RepID=A0A974Y0V2_9GAMM|nr:chemotaxis protein CheB [Lysobacter solisilvae]QSX78483.1 hypothetical protein I8J32_000515 [Lysobacter solisilvae]